MRDSNNHSKVKGNESKKGGKTTDARINFSLVTAGVSLSPLPASLVALRSIPTVSFKVVPREGKKRKKGKAQQPGSEETEPQGKWETAYKYKKHGKVRAIAVRNKCSSHSKVVE